MRRILPLNIAMAVLAVAMGCAWLALGPVAKRAASNYHHLLDPIVDQSEYDQVLERSRIDEKSGAIRVHQLADWLNLTVDRGDLSELDHTWDSSPGNGRYWLPSSGIIEDAYGLLLATLMMDLAQDEIGTKDYTKLKQLVETWQNTFNASADKSRLSRLSASNILATSIAVTLRNIPVDREMTPELRDLMDDFLAYDARFENGSRRFTLTPNLASWIKEKPTRLRPIAVGTIQAFKGESGASGPRFKAVLWGREQAYFALKRPDWFKSAYIKTARRRSIYSNRYASFFGTEGLLERIPIGIICVKKPQYIIQAIHDGRIVMSQQTAFQFMSPDRRFLISGSNRIAYQDGNYWKVDLPNSGTQLTAIVSERM